MPALVVFYFVTFYITQYLISLVFWFVLPLSLYIYIFFLKKHLLSLFINIYFLCLPILSKERESASTLVLEVVKLFTPINKDKLFFFMFGKFLHYPKCLKYKMFQSGRKRYRCCEHVPGYSFFENPFSEFWTNFILCNFCLHLDLLYTSLIRRFFYQNKP